MRKLLFLLSCIVFAVAPAASAQAAVVTVGSPLVGSFPGISIGSGNTLLNLKGPANPVSPVTGAVVGWNVTGASGGPFNLRILTPVGGGEYVGVAKSAAATPSNTGLQHFDTLLPIKAGQTVALDHTKTEDKIGARGLAGAEWGFFPSAPLGEGVPAEPTHAPGFELGFNAEVQPAPVILTLGATSGSVAGGTSVLISGTELQDATTVKFGATSASFGQVSESALVATAPPSMNPGGVPISVTTRAGTATSSQLFTYDVPATATTVPQPLSTTVAAAKCTVPDLVGRHLKPAKRSIRARHCKVGLVHMEEGVTARTGTVVKQNPKPGTTRTAGSVVNVKLG